VPLNNQQIKLLQTAVRAAGLRAKGREERYRLLLRQYRQSDGSAVTSCKQLSNSQLGDLLAICEAHGFRMPGKAEDHFRRKVRSSRWSSYAQREAIKHLAGDLGIDVQQLGKFVSRMTKGNKRGIVSLTKAEAYNIIEGLKAMFGRGRGKHYNDLNEIKEDTEASHG